MYPAYEDKNGDLNFAMNVKRHNVIVASNIVFKETLKYDENNKIYKDTPYK